VSPRMRTGCEISIILQGANQCPESVPVQTLTGPTTAAPLPPQIGLWTSALDRVAESCKTTSDTVPHSITLTAMASSKSDASVPFASIIRPPHRRHGRWAGRDECEPPQRHFCKKEKRFSRTAAGRLDWSIQRRAAQCRSATLLKAGCARFFTLTQCLHLPPR
jgi:hypothetical protein